MARTLTMGWVTLTMLGGVQLHQRFSEEQNRYAVWQLWMKVWAGLLVKVFGVELVRLGPLPSTATSARLVIANHRSPMDIALLLNLFGGHVLSRNDLVDWPILGLAARKAGTIFVDRESANSGISAIRQIRNNLKEGRTVIVFPEGTTFRGDEVHEFFAGVFTALRGLDVELLPVGIAYQQGTEFFRETFIQHLARVANRPKTRVAVHIGSCRRAEGKHRELAHLMRAEVQQLVNGARVALDDSGKH